MHELTVLDSPGYEMVSTCYVNQKDSALHSANIHAYL